MDGNIARNQKYETLIADLLNGERIHELREFSDYISGLSVASRYQYLKTIRDFLSKANKSPQKLKFADYVGDLAKYKYKENGEEMTASAQQTRYFALKRFSEFMYTYGYAPDDYMSKVLKPKGTDSEKTITKRQSGYLNPSEVRQLMTNLSNKVSETDGVANDVALRDLAIFYVFLTTGIRQNALTCLDIDDIDLNKKEMRVTDKGRKVRIYQLSQDCTNALNNWIKAREKHANKEKDAVFLQNRKTNCFGHITEGGWQRMQQFDIDALVKRETAFTGRKLSAHKLRATYGTILYEKTKDIYFVQSCMGHASPTTTERYIRGIQNNTGEASAIINDLFNV